MREARFVRCYVGEAQGNGRLAVRLAGYRGEAGVLDVQAARLLGRERVRIAVEGVLRAEAERSGLTKGHLVQKVQEVLVEGRPFERLKAAELLARLMGWLASSRHVGTLLGVNEGPDNYVALADTLRSHAKDFSPPEREAMRRTLEQVIAQATAVLELLGTVNTDEQTLMLSRH